MSVKHVIIAGDFNIDLLVDSAAKNKYCDLLSDFQLIQSVSGPSRVTDVSSTLIDHILSTLDISVSFTTQATGLSDHNVQIVDFDITVQRSVSEFRWIRPFRACCWENIRNCLSTAPWMAMDSFDNIGDMWDYFSGLLDYCLDSYVRVSCKYSRRHTPWMTPEILCSIKEKDKAKRRAEHTKDPDDLVRYKKLKNQLKSTICQSKLSCFASLLKQSHKSPQLTARL